MKKLLNKIQKEANHDCNIILKLTLNPLFFLLLNKHYFPTLTKPQSHYGHV